jgi:hypothetical protein
MVDEIEKENKECRDQWVNVLTGNPKAIEQLRDALEALKKQKESGQPAADQQPTPDAGDQADVSNDNINVYSAPSPEVTQYIIDNSDSYPDLAAEAIWYWDRWPYWHHWRHWGPWPPYPYPGPWPHPWPHPWPPGPLYKAGQNAPPHPLQDLHGLAASHDFHQNPALLKEWARLNKQSPLPQNILTEDKSRVQTLTAQRQQYPNLTGKLDSFAQQHPEHPVNQWRQGVAPQATTPVATPERPVRGRPTSLSAGELSQPQRISSGVMVHRGSWNAMSGGFYGGAYRGGFHGGGFRR